MRRIALSTVLGLVGLTALATGAARAEDKFFLFSDTQLSFWHEFSGAEPGLLTPITKNVVSLTHFDAWKYGTNFVNVDVLQSDNRDPEAPWTGPNYPMPTDGSGVGNGAVEVDITYRGTLGLNELANTKAFSFGPVKNLSLYFGGDFTSKNTAFAPRQRSFEGGLQVNFDVPGYLNIAAVVYKEFNHNGIVALSGYPPGQSEYVEFSTTAAFELQYMQPLIFTGLPLRISGFSNLVMPKGTDGFGLQTLAELISDNRLTLDVGKLVADREQRVDAFVGYRFWVNKFGTAPYPSVGPPLPGTTESTFYVGGAVHL